MNPLVGIVVVVPLLGVCFLVWVLYNSVFKKKKKREKRLETVVDNIPPDARPFIYFAGKELVGQLGVGTGYEGYIVGGKHSDGKYILRIHDLRSDTEAEIGPVVMDNNVILMPSSDLLFGKVTFRCNIDFDNRLCKWDPMMVEKIGYEMSKITQQRIEAEVKRKLNEQLEYKLTRSSRSMEVSEFAPPPSSESR